MIKIINKLIITEILKILNSSQTIEATLEKTYKDEMYLYSHKGIKLTNLPLFNAHLYNLIYKSKELPSYIKFIDSYITENYDFLEESSNKLKALRLSAYQAYTSLVRDLHFYFILKESELFEDVRIDYFYDLYVKHDILVTFEGEKLGIQLFSGSKEAYLKKLRNHKRKKLIAHYKEMFFSFRDEEHLRKSIMLSNGGTMKLHSKEDVYKVISFIKKDETLLIEDLQINEFVQPNKIPETEIFNIISDVKHSILFIGKENTMLKSEIEKNFKSGVKIDLITTNTSTAESKGITKHYLSNLGDEIKIIDGENMTDDLITYILELSNSSNSFNGKQYIAEHANSKGNIMVTAGAGSGKTWTMISRILYLLHTGKVTSLKEIGMITFTNEAADQLRFKLNEELLDKFMKTKNPKYIKYLEDLSNMTISTIPKFAKSVFNKFSHYLGFGNDIKISSNVLERRRIISRNLELSIKEFKLPMSLLENIQNYELIEIIETIWNKIESKGIVYEELEKIDWGHNSPDEIDLITQVFENVIKTSEKDMNNYKKESDWVSVEDLTRFLKQINKTNIPLQLLNNDYKYLFIDEFQDTDDSQIEFIATISARANIRLFVVGDIKQSIYRFRGANSTAFEVLINSLENKGSYNNKIYNLNRNYRTSSNLLKRMEENFSKWRIKGLLPLNEEPLFSFKSSTYDQEKEFEIPKGKFDVKALNKYFEEMKVTYKSIDSKEEAKVVSILVRKNKEVEEIRELIMNFNIENQNNKITFIAKKDGSLFSSKPAKDLFYLITSWLFSENDYHKYVLSQTIYGVENNFNPIEFKRDMSTYYYQNSTINISITGAWEKSFNDLKANSAIYVINQFIAEFPFQEILSKSGFNEYESELYIMNVKKILMLISENLDNLRHDLYSIWKWFSIQVATNNNEDEEEPDKQLLPQFYIEIVTVHKAKGLEYDTVIIPYTSNSFLGNSYYGDNILVHIDNNSIKCGWKIEKGNSEEKFVHRTSNYEELSLLEIDETVKEETRLLYVAMTRAMQRLIIYKNAKKKKSTQIRSWSDLFVEGER